MNAVRHGYAQEVSVECRREGAAVLLVIAYEGRPFPGFQGRHDLLSLDRMQTGPRTLKERVAHVGGDLVIHANEDGARVEILIPAE